MIVGVVTIANFLIPYLLYKFYFNTTRTTAVQAIFDAQSKYQFGWYVMNEGAKFIWGPPAFFWIMATLTGDIRFALFLLIWWSSFQTYMTPLIILGTAGPMMWGASISTWEDSYDDVMNQYHVFAAGLAYLIFGGISYYLFVTNWSYALLYYDPVLQEEEEELVQFGEPTKEEDLPEE